MNLLLKLKEPYLNRLEKENINYPHLVSSIIESLENEKYVLDLTYGTILNLELFLGHTSSPYDYFNIEK